MSRIERDRELSRRRHRKVKLLKLIEKFAHASGSDKDDIAAKVRRISPFYDLNARVAELTAAGKLRPAKAGKK
jgi:hypothetical protein